MAPGPGPLADSALAIQEVGMSFFELWAMALKWPWPFRNLSGPFWNQTQRCFAMSRWLYHADARIESLGWDEFIWSPGAWLLVRLGADIGRAEYFRYRPWAWVIWKFRKEHIFLDALIAGDFWWIRDYVESRWPILRDISQDPGGWIRDTLRGRFPKLYYLFDQPDLWILQQLGIPWYQRFMWKDHLLAWVLYRWGLNWVESFSFEADPKGFIRTIIHQRWPFLNAIYYDPYGWFWYMFEETVETYIESKIDWVISIGERVLNRLWQTPTR